MSRSAGRTPPSPLLNCFPHQPIVSPDNEPLVCHCNAPYRAKLEEERERNKHRRRECLLAGHLELQQIKRHGYPRLRLKLHYKQKQRRDNEREFRWPNDLSKLSNQKTHGFDSSNQCGRYRFACWKRFKHTHAHTLARTHARTHTHTHTLSPYIYIYTHERMQWTINESLIVK